MSESDPKRGPRVGDAASLWNFTRSPGWTMKEADVLRYALKAHGVGRWVQIVDDNVLPGKLIQQLYGQTQRLIGQQSLAAYTGLRVDVDRIREDNHAKINVERKSGLVIYTGPNPSKETKEAWRKEALEKYGLSDEQVRMAEQKLLELVPLEERRSSNALAGQPFHAELLDSDTSKLSKREKIDLLKRLRQYSDILLGRIEVLKPKLEGNTTEPEPHRRALDRNEENVPATVSALGKDVVKGKGRHRKRKRKENDSTAANTKGEGKKSTRSSRRSKSAQNQMHTDARYQLEDVEALLAMGYPKGKAQDALAATGDVQLAVEWLLANCAQ